LVTDFNLYEFGALVPNGGGLVRLELEYMDIELPPANNSDFNGDGDVDGADFLTWQRGLGLTGQTTKANGDANGDGTVNGADLAIWKSHFAGPPSTGAASGVPEPTAAMLAFVAMATTGVVRRRTQV
jgi:hypothetical protein